MRNLYGTSLGASQKMTAPTQGSEVVAEGNTSTVPSAEFPGIRDAVMSYDVVYDVIDAEPFHLVPSRVHR